MLYGQHPAGRAAINLVAAAFLGDFNRCQQVGRRRRPSVSVRDLGERVVYDSIRTGLVS